MSIPVKPAGVPSTAAAAQAPAYVTASPAVQLEGVNQNLLNFCGYLALVHRLLFSAPLVITSGKDSQHVAGSLHAEGLAVDIRTRDLAPDAQLCLLAVLNYAAPENKIAVFDERALGGEAHIHLEYHGA